MHERFGTDTASKIRFKSGRFLFETVRPDVRRRRRNVRKLKSKGVRWVQTATCCRDGRTCCDSDWSSERSRDANTRASNSESLEDLSKKYKDVSARSTYSRITQSLIQGPTRNQTQVRIFRDNSTQWWRHEEWSSHVPSGQGSERKLF